MDVAQLAFADATEIAARIRAGDVTSVACLEMYLDRIARHDPALNAIVVPDFARARRQAEAADLVLAAGEDPLGPLHGVPITVKEAFDLKGLPTTFGIPFFMDSCAERDADVVTRLRAAGAVILGKTNVPINLTDFQSYNAIYGTTNNPWDTTRTPGGSSGGESAALAAGLCGLGCGSDIGSSLRNPAHYTGTYAHKPTHGIVPHAGHSPVPLASLLDLGVFGPMARSARDLALGMEVMTCPDPLISPGYRLALPRPSKRLSELRVAVWADDPLAPVAGEVAERCRQVGRTLAEAGAQVSDTARPAFDPAAAHSCYRKLLMSALSITQPEEEMVDNCRKAAAFDPGDPGREAQRAWNRVMPHRRWLELNEERTHLRFAWQAFFAEWDVVIAPIALTTAFPHDHSPLGGRTIMVDGQARDYFSGLFWAGLATLCYLPSTAIPTGPGRDGLPIGVQLIGGEFHDLITIDIAQRLAELGYAFVPPPGFE